MTSATVALRKIRSSIMWPPGWMTDPMIVEYVRNRSDAELAVIFGMAPNDVAALRQWARERY